jgi:hypothetical protein
VPNLHEWLLPHAQKSGPIAAYLNMTEQLLDLRKAINSRREKRKEAGKFVWKHNRFATFFHFVSGRSNAERGSGGTGSWEQSPNDFSALS